MSREPARRQILCPRCEIPQEVSRNAKSILCPGCHRNIATEDIEINEYCAKIEMFTAGRVLVGKKGTLIAEVRAEEISLKGEIKGPVKSLGLVTLEKGGRLFGNLTCTRLRVEDGAQLVGMIVTGPGAAEFLAEIGAAPAPPPVRASA
jgi:hypothetical protein